MCDPSSANPYEDVTYVMQHCVWDCVKNAGIMKKKQCLYALYSFKIPFFNLENESLFRELSLYWI